MSILIITNHVTDYRHHQFEALCNNDEVFVYNIQINQPNYRKWQQVNQKSYMVISLRKLLRNLNKFDLVLMLENGRQTMFINILVFLFSIFSHSRIYIWYGLSTVPKNKIKLTIYKYLYRFYLSLSEGVLCYSDAALQTFSAISKRNINTKSLVSGQQYPFREVYNTQPREKLSIPSLTDATRLEILFIGQDISRKGVDYMMAELKLLSAQINVKIHVTLCGGSFNEVCGNQSIKVTKIPYAGVHLKKQLFSNTNFLIVPSRHDPWPHVVSESIGFGVYPLISSVCGNAGVIYNLSYGIAPNNVFNVDVRNSLSNLILGLLHDDILRKITCNNNELNNLLSLDQFCTDIQSLKANFED
jgi:glycosyltransferase involved in cell wall biosynthesis